MFQISGVSLSGSFRKLSKVVLLAVMIRGRHRGLPIAIDRAVLLPRDIELHDRDSTTREDEVAEADGDACPPSSSSSNRDVESGASPMPLGTETTRPADAEDEKHAMEDDAEAPKSNGDDRRLSGESNRAGSADGSSAGGVSSRPVE
jgi:hypothetical protein